MASNCLAVAVLMYLGVTVSISQELGWIVAGPNRTADGVPSCSFCLNAVNATAFQNWSGLAVGVYRCLKFDSNELWAINSASHAIFLRDLVNNTLCIDAGYQSDYSGTNFTFLPMKLSPCDGSLRQQWFFNSETRHLESGLTTENGITLFMVQGDLPSSGVPYTAPYYNLYLASSVPLNSRSANAQFTFQAASNYRPLLLRNFAGLDGSASGNLVGNGGFERSTIFPRWPPGQNCSENQTGTCIKSIIVSTELFCLCSWAVGANAPEWISDRRPYWNSAEGNASLLLSNGGGVNQTIPVQPKSEYVLSFSMAGFLSHSPGLDSYQLCSRESGYIFVQVGISQAPVVFGLDQSEVSRNGQDTKWVTKTIPFTASGSDTIISFNAAAAQKSPCGIVIDDVSVSLDTRQQASVSSSHGSSKTAAAAASVAATGVVVLASALIGALVWRRRQLLLLPSSLLTGNPEAQNMKVLSYRQIQRATGNWSTVLGTGAFSTVYRADFPDGTVGAVKVENKTGAMSVEPSLCRDELALLLRVNHRDLVNLIGYCNEKARPILVFEYLPNGTLYQRLHEAPSELTFPWRSRMRAMYQVACALEYLHHGSSPPTVHRDIKSANVLLTATDSAKLADFGLSRSAPPGATTFQSIESNAKVKGSLGYLDPKYLRSGIYSTKSDVYSFGVLLLETITGHTAIKDGDLLAYWAAEYIEDPLTAHEMVDSRLMGEYVVLELHVLVHLVRMCLQSDPQQRPSMHQVVSFLADSVFCGNPPPTPPAVPHSIRSSFATPVAHSFETDASPSGDASTSSQSVYY